MSDQKMEQPNVVDEVYEESLGGVCKRIIDGFQAELLRNPLLTVQDYVDGGGKEMVAQYIKTWVRRTNRANDVLERSRERLMRHLYDWEIKKILVEEINRSIQKQ